MSGAIERLEQPSEGKLWEFYRAAFETRLRLGLKPGYYVLNIDDEAFSRVDLAVETYDRTYIEVVENPVAIGSGLQGQPYELKRTHSIGINGQGWNYSARDILEYDSSYSGTDDSELTSANEDIDTFEPLPPEIADVLQGIIRVLPTLRYDQIDFETDLTYEWDEHDEERYDRRKILELQSLEDALSSAGGAFYLLQLATLRRHRRRRGPRRNANEFPISKTNSIYQLTAFHDPSPSESSPPWHPTILQAEERRWGSNYGSGDKFNHVVTRAISELDGKIHFTTGHSLERTHELIDVSCERTVYDPAELLPDTELGLVKHLLKEIMGIKR